MGQHETRSKTEPINSVSSMYDPFTHLLPAPVCPKTKLSTQKGWPKGSRAGAVHGPWLEVLRNHMRHVASSSCFAEVDIDAFKLKLQIRIAVVADYLPKLGSKMIPALTALDVDKTQPTNMMLLLLLLLLLSLGL